MLLARLILYPALFLVAAIGMLDGAVFLGLIALIVPGLILIAAPTVALYAPFVDLLVTGLFKRRPALWLPGLVAITLIAFAVPFAAGRALDARIAAATASDFQRDPGGAPKRLFLHDYRRTQGSSDGHYAGRWIYSGTENGGCDETCARLLLSRQVEAIIRPTGKAIRGPIPLEHGFAGEAVVFTYEPAAGACPAADQGRLNVRADTLALIGSGHCIVMREVTAPVFDAAVTTLAESFDTRRLDAVSSGLRSVATRSLWRCRAGACVRTARLTSVSAERLATPLAIGIENNADMHMRRDFWRRSRTVNSVTRDDWMMRRLGLRPAALPAADPARLRGAAEGALAAAASDDRGLTQPEQEAVGRVLQAIAETRTGPSGADIALLRTIVLHPTADWLPHLGEVFRKHPEAGVQLADAVIAGYARTARRERPERQNDLRRILARVIADLPPGSFADHGPAILRAAAVPGALKDADTLLTRLGDLGPAALPLLAMALDERGDAGAAAFGLCRIGAPAAGLAPRISAMYDAGAWNRDRSRVAAVALARIGRPDLIRRPPAEAYRNTNAAGKRYDEAWFDTVPRTITPASPADICSDDTTDNRMARRLKAESR